jgi:hypothetical protein
MLPTPAGQYTGDRSTGGAVLQRKLGDNPTACPTPPSHLDHLSVTQAGPGVFLTLRGASFPAGICEIISGGAQKEMVGPNARRIVAVMQNVELGGKYTVGQPVRIPVCRFDTGLQVWPLTAEESPISVGVHRSGPNPAIAGSVHSGPEAGFDRRLRLSQRGGVTGSRAEDSAGKAEAIGMNPEGTSTLATIAPDRARMRRHREAPFLGDKVGLCHQSHPYFIISDTAGVA